MSDLILNGDFASPIITAPQGFVQFDTPGAPAFKWKIAWVGSTPGLPRAEVQKTAPDGQYLELASDAPYEISQTITPLPGQAYVFSFRAKARSGYNSKFLARLTMSGGVVVEYPVTPGPTWKTYSFCQCPTGKQVVVSFVGLGTDAGGALIDDIRYAN